jgi:hypothetical protein
MKESGLRPRGNASPFINKNNGKGVKHMSMEKFIKQQIRDVPAVTIRNNGSICINRKAVEQFKIEGIRFVTLHHDPKEGLLGIRPEEDESDPSAFRISREKGRTFTLSCQAFLKKCGIPYRNGSKVYRTTWDDKAKMIMIKL